MVLVDRNMTAYFKMVAECSVLIHLIMWKMTSTLLIYVFFFFLKVSCAFALQWYSDCWLRRKSCLLSQQWYFLYLLFTGARPDLLDFLWQPRLPYEVGRVQAPPFWCDPIVIAALTGGTASFSHEARKQIVRSREKTPYFQTFFPSDCDVFCTAV